MMFFVGLLTAAVWGAELYGCWRQGYLDFSARQSWGGALWLYLVTFGTYFGLIMMTPVLETWASAASGPGRLFRETPRGLEVELRMAIPRRLACWVPLILLVLFGMLGLGLASSHPGPPIWVGAVLALGVVAAAVGSGRLFSSYGVLIHQGTGRVEVRARRRWSVRSMVCGHAVGLQIIDGPLRGIINEPKPAAWLVVTTDKGFVPVATSHLGYVPRFSERSLERLAGFWERRLRERYVIEEAVERSRPAQHPEETP